MLESVLLHASMQVVQVVSVSSVMTSFAGASTSTSTGAVTIEEQPHLLQHSKPGFRT